MLASAEVECRRWGELCQDRRVSGSTGARCAAGEGRLGRRISRLVAEIGLRRPAAAKHGGAASTTTRPRLAGAPRRTGARTLRYAATRFLRAGAFFGDSSTFVPSCACALASLTIEPIGVATALAPWTAVSPMLAAA